MLPIYVWGITSFRHNRRSALGRAWVLVVLMVMLVVAAACSAPNPVTDPDPTDQRPSGQDGSSDTAPNGEATTENNPGDERSPDAGSPQDPSPEVEPLVEPDAVTVAQVADLPGRLAIGRGGRLSIGETDGSEVRVLNDGVDAEAAQPTWSADGTRLVWSRVSGDGHAVVVSSPEGEVADVVTPLVGSPAFYFQWSADGTTVAYLRNAQDRRGVELGLVDPGRATATIGTVSPFFVAWAPTGASAMAAHIGSSQLVQLVEPRLVFDDTEVAPSVLLEPTGAFSTPTWIDERTVLAGDASGLILIDIETLQTETVVSFDGVGRPVRFVVSPDRTKVAYQLVRGDGAPLATSVPFSAPTSTRTATRTVAGPASPRAIGQPLVAASVEAESGLVVVDLARETSEVVTDRVALAWEWSPTSDRLAWLEPVPSRTDRLARWNFWVDAGTDVASSPVHRVPDVVAEAYLPFFEQYAHSVTGWSPDGSAFAFAGRHQAEPMEATDSIWVQLVVASAVPVRVAEGDRVAWSR